MDYFQNSQNKNSRSDSLFASFPVNSTGLCFKKTALQVPSLQMATPLSENVAKTINS